MRRPSRIRDLRDFDEQDDLTEKKALLELSKSKLYRELEKAA